VLADFNKVTASINKDGGEEFRKSILKQRRSADNNNADKSLSRLNTREAEIKRIIKKLLEQNAAGVISDELFTEMYGPYAVEMNTIAAKIREAEAKLEDNKRFNDDIENFVAITGKYINAKELTRGLLTDLIDKIVVYEANTSYNSGIVRKQRVDVSYRFLGVLHDQDDR